MCQAYWNDWNDSTYHCTSSSMHTTSVHTSPIALIVSDPVFLPTTPPYNQYPFMLPYGMIPGYTGNAFPYFFANGLQLPESSGPLHPTPSQDTSYTPQCNFLSLPSAQLVRND